MGPKNGRKVRFLGGPGCAANIANNVQNLYFQVFYRVPFQDRLRTSIWEVLGGFGAQVGTLWTSIRGSAGNFAAMFVLLNLCWIFVGFWVPAGGGESNQLRGTRSPRPAFSDICGRNRGCRYRGVAFSGFPEYLLR